jgi:hypothetical protein
MAYAAAQHKVADGNLQLPVWGIAV